MNYLTLRDEFLRSTAHVREPNRRVVLICRRAEAARKERPEAAQVLKRACFHACLAAMKAGLPRPGSGAC